MTNETHTNATYTGIINLSPTTVHRQPTFRQDEETDVEANQPQTYPPSQKADHEHDSNSEPQENQRFHAPSLLRAVPDSQELHRFWARLSGQTRAWIGWRDSARAIVTASWINVLLVFIPFAWAAHFAQWSHVLTFILCFISIVPLERLFEFGGEELAFYVGKDLGDLIAITLNNSVEAVLAIYLLARCNLVLLQSTIVGVVLLHLLLIPGVSFVTGGVYILEQYLSPHATQLNQTLLTIGVLTLLLPAAFFAALDRGASAVASDDVPTALVNDVMRGQFLKMSRGLAIILLLVYICSRIYLHNPPGEGNSFRPPPDAPEELKKLEDRYKHENPKVNPWACILLLAVTIAIMAVTAEWLVDSIEFVADEGSIQQGWFGLILLPIVSFAADGTIAIGFFLRSVLRAIIGGPSPPVMLAKARAIDLSIQFTLFWMPFLVLLGWWTDKPVLLLFDFFEVALLLGACFLVNYVTADAKTNWAEGMVLVSFYIMIALCSWFYPGQAEVRDMLACRSVDATLAGGVSE